MRAQATTAVTALGAGLNWGALALRVADFGASPAFLDNMLTSLPALSLSMVGACLAVLLLSRWLCRPRAMAALGAATLAASAVILLRSLVRLPSSPVGFLLPQGVFSILVGVCGALLIVEWGLAFVAMEKRETIRLNVLACLIGSLVYLAGACLQPDAGLVLRNAAMLASAALFLPARPAGGLSPDPGAPGASKRPLARFYLLRAALGAAAGFTSAVAMFFPTAAGQGAWCALGAAALVAALLAWLVRAPDERLTVVLPLVPLIALGVAAAPVLGGDASHLPAVTSVLIWLSWITLSSTQVSEVRLSAPVGAAALVASEKLAFYLFRPAGLLAACLLCGRLGADAMLVPVGVVAYFSVMAIMAFLVALSATRERDKVIQSAAEDNDYSYTRACQELSEEFGLTERERDVLALLVDGLSRPRIGEKLSISEGTVRTHAKSIYRKLGCNSREQVRQLVERRRRPLG